MTDPRECRDPDLGVLLGAYELGLLPAEETAALEEHLAACVPCQDALFDMAPASAAVRGDPGRVRTALAAAEAAAGTSPAGARGRLRALLGRGVGPRLWAPAAALAAAVLLAVLFAPQHGPRTAADLADLAPAPYRLMDTRNAPSGESERLFRDAMALYGVGAYAAAADRLARCEAAGEAEPEWPGLDDARFYLGVSLLLDGRPGEAEAPLARAAAASLPVRSERAQWYRAQAALVRGDTRQAEELLARLAREGVARRELAARQLEALRKLRAGSGGDETPPEAP